MPRTASIGIRVEPTLKGELEHAGRHDRRTVASLIERIALEWLARHGWTQPPAGAYAPPIAASLPAVMPGPAAQGNGPSLAERFPKTPNPAVAWAGAAAYAGNSRVAMNHRLPKGLLDQFKFLADKHGGSDKALLQVAVMELLGRELPRLGLEAFPCGANSKCQRLTSPEPAGSVAA